MSYKARPEQLVAEGYDATVGAASTNADYNDIQDAINAGKYKILTLENFTQPTQISNGSNFVEITISERLKFTSSSANFNIGSADVKIRGTIVETAYTSGTVTLFPNSTGGGLDAEGVYFLDTSSGATVHLGQLFGKKHRIHNCTFTLPNNANAGFDGAADGSSFTNLSVIGGGSSCKGFITQCVDGIIDDIHFDGDTFENNGVMIQVAGLSKGLKAFADTATVSNIVCEPGNNTMLISISNSFVEVANISGSISVECKSSNNHFVNIGGIDLSFSGTTNNNLFSNCRFGGSTAISLPGDYNKLVNCDFTAAFTLAAGSNNNQLLICSSTGGFTDNGTNNSIIEQITNGKPLLLFGNNGVFNTTATRYLYPGNSDSLAPTSIVNIVMPFSGIARNMHVYHNTPAGNGNNIVYTLVKNGTPQSLTVTIPSTTQTASDTTNAVAFATGDRLALEVTKALSIATSPSDITVTMEIC